MKKQKNINDFLTAFLTKNSKSNINKTKRASKKELNTKHAIVKQDNDYTFEKIN